MYCVEKVIRYTKDGSPKQTWICTKTDCSQCEGYCDDNVLSMTVSNTKASSISLLQSLYPILDCVYGDAVKIEKKGVGSDPLSVREIAIVGKPGEKANL